MLAQNFKTPADLEISEAQHSALVRTLAFFESGKLRHHSEVGPDEECFDLSEWKCGSAACIGGWAELLSGHAEYTLFGPSDIKPTGLDNLFYPDSREILTFKQMRGVSVPQAATALRTYLTTGDPAWREIVRD